MLSVVMLSVIMLNVVVPFCCVSIVRLLSLVLHLSARSEPTLVEHLKVSHSTLLADIRRRRKELKTTNTLAY
jgi:hypothetical protein